MDHGLFLKWIQNGNVSQIEKKILPGNYLLNTNALCIGYDINSKSSKIPDHKERVIIQEFDKTKQ